MTMIITGAIPEYEIIAPKEAVIAWKHDEVTLQILRIIREEIEASEVRMGRGESLGEDAIQKTARAVGYIDGLKFLETITDVIDILEDNEDSHERNKKESKAT